MDLGEMVRGRQKRVGLGVHIIDGGRLSNVVLTPKYDDDDDGAIGFLLEDREDGLGTFGFRVRPGLTISKGEEIFQ
jgi:hypothetical protein